MSSQEVIKQGGSKEDGTRMDNKPYWTPKDAAAFGYFTSVEEDDEE